MIEPLDGKGVSRAKAICDDCGREEIVAADYERVNFTTRTVNEGQVRRKLCGHGWSDIKGKLRCPTCEAKRKAIPEKLKEEKPMNTATVTELRQPTPEIRRDIHRHLLQFYDDKAKRYKDGATDKEMADMIGGGCMPGWVGTIRESDYGPDGASEEMHKLMAEISTLKAAFDRYDKNARIHIQELESIAREAADGKAKMAALEKRQNALIAAVGPKAARV